MIDDDTTPDDTTPDDTTPTDGDPGTDDGSGTTTGQIGEIGYAGALAELDEILRELDDDGIDIDVLSERVERAAHLIAICRQRISTAQERVAGIVDGLDNAPDGADTQAGNSDQ